MESGGCADSSTHNWPRVSRPLSGVPRGDDVADWRVGTAAKRALEVDAAHRDLGCHGLCDLAVDLRTQQHTVAQRRLQDPRGHACACHSESCAGSRSIKTCAGRVLRRSYAFLDFATAEVARSARGSDVESFPGKPICKRRSFFGSRQLTCGSISEASTRSRYFIAMFISESSSESVR